MVMACDYKGNTNDGEMMMITVENRADLEIVSVEWVSTEVETGEKARVKVGVRNNGYTTVKDYTVVLVSGSETLASAQESTGILPGKVHSYTLEWRTEGAGDKIVRVDVDPGNTVTESDETNNRWDQQTISISEGDSSVPGMGAALAVVATAAVAVALLDRRRR